MQCTYNAIAPTNQSQVSFLGLPIIRLDWLATGPQGSFCFCCSTELTYVHCYTKLLGAEDWIQVLMLAHQLNHLPSQPCFLKNILPLYLCECLSFIKKMLSFITFKYNFRLSDCFASYGKSQLEKIFLHRQMSVTQGNYRFLGFKEILPHHNWTQCHFLFLKTLVFKNSKFTEEL